MRTVEAVRAELHTLCQLDNDARRQYRSAQAKIRDLAQFSDGLLIAIEDRRGRADELLDELTELLKVEEAGATT